MFLGRPRCRRHFEAKCTIGLQSRAGSRVLSEVSLKTNGLNCLFGPGRIVCSAIAAEHRRSVTGGRSSNYFRVIKVTGNDRDLASEHPVQAEAVSRQGVAPVLVADWAMGTVLYSKGIFINRCFDELDLSQPALVKEAHQEYVKAGA